MVALHLAADFTGVALLACRSDAFPESGEPCIDGRRRRVNPRMAEAVHGHVVVGVRLAAPRDHAALALGDPDARSVPALGAEFGDFLTGGFHFEIPFCFRRFSYLVSG